MDAVHRRQVGCPRAADSMCLTISTSVVLQEPRLVSGFKSQRLVDITDKGTATMVQHTLYWMRITECTCHHQCPTRTSALYQALSTSYQLIGQSRDQRLVRRFS